MTVMAGMSVECRGSTGLLPKWARETVVPGLSLSDVVTLQVGLSPPTGS